MRAAGLLATVATVATLAAAAGFAAPVRVRHTEGLLHGFLVVRTQAGEIIATGDLSQAARGDRVTSRLALHFKDGSLHEETVVYSQRGSFRLIRDHVLQKGPSFPHATDFAIDAAGGAVAVKRTGDDGKRADLNERLALPADLVNGLVSVVLKNLEPGSAETTLPLLVATPKPHLADLTIMRDGTDQFSLAGSRHEADRYTIKVKLRGGAGVVATLLEKQPPDYHVWILHGDAPVFLRSDGPLYSGGPVWRIELASPVWP
jgi:hypothetical protein